MGESFRNKDPTSKSLIAANKMLPTNKYKEIKKEMGTELLALENFVHKKYPETKKLNRKN